MMDENDIIRVSSVLSTAAIIVFSFSNPQLSFAWMIPSTKIEPPFLIASDVSEICICIAILKDDPGNAKKSICSLLGPRTRVEQILPSILILTAVIEKQRYFQLLTTRIPYIYNKAGRRSLWVSLLLDLPK